MCEKEEENEEEENSVAKICGIYCIASHLVIFSFFVSQLDGCKAFILQALLVA